MKTLLALITAVATLAFASSALGDTFITDTLAPGGKPAPVQGYRFITDTLAPGGKPAPVQGYRFITDTLAPGGGSSAPIAVRSSVAFSWSDAGVGAGAAVGGMLALIGSALIVVRRQGRLAV
jgi:hypothetical protein